MRKLLKCEEATISGSPQSATVLVLQYRGKLGSTGLPDDAVLVALKVEQERYRVLSTMESETSPDDGGRFWSGNDYDVDFITIGEMKLLYIQDHADGFGNVTEHQVYMLLKDGLFQIPFVWSSPGQNHLLNPGEELRNGQIAFRGGAFYLDVGIYDPKDGECCPTHGSYHSIYELKGSAQPEGVKPTLHFEETKRWMTPD